MSTPIPADELHPIVLEALTYPRRGETRAFTAKLLWTVVDAELRNSHPEYHVHEQSVRRILNELVATGDAYTRRAEAKEYPSTVGTSPYLFSLHDPVPRYDPDWALSVTESLPDPRTPPITRRSPRITTQDPPRIVTPTEPDARVDLICTLVRELAHDLATPDQVHELEKELIATKAELKSARRALKRIEGIISPTA